jgi:hypothetical protein
MEAPLNMPVNIRRDQRQNYAYWQARQAAREIPYDYGNSFFDAFSCHSLRCIQYNIRSQEARFYSESFGRFGEDFSHLIDACDYGFYGSLLVDVGRLYYGCQGLFYKVVSPRTSVYSTSYYIGQIARAAIGIYGYGGYTNLYDLAAFSWEVFCRGGEHSPDLVNRICSLWKKTKKE